MSQIRWRDIEAECGGYRAGFVATFRKYEGQATDELDAYRRPVKVTKASFARHLGVSDVAFGRWIRAEDGRTRSYPSPGKTRSGQMGRQIAKSPTTAVDDKVGMLEDLLSDKAVRRAFQKKRAPIISEHDRKAAKAATDSALAPLTRALPRLMLPAWCDELDSMAQEIAEGEFSEAEIKKLGRKARAVITEIEVHEFRLGVTADDAKR